MLTQFVQRATGLGGGFFGSVQSACRLQDHGGVVRQGRQQRNLICPVTRWLRDRVLMPLASQLAGEGATGRVLQETPHALAAMCRV